MFERRSLGEREVIAAREVKCRNPLARVTLDAIQQVHRMQSGTVDDEARIELGGGLAPSGHAKTVVEPCQAFHATVDHQRTAGVLHVTLKGEHVGMLIDDATGGAMQYRGTAHLRLQFVGFGGREQAHARDFIATCAFLQGEQHLLFVVTIGDDELATVLVFDAAGRAVLIERAIARHAETGLETSGRVIQAGVDHAAVACRSDGAVMALGFKQQYLTTGERKCARHRETYHTCADHDAFDPIRHILNLSCRPDVFSGGWRKP
jgi:hypothetical protein